MSHMINHFKCRIPDYCISGLLRKLSKFTHFAWCRFAEDSLIALLCRFWRTIKL